MNVLFISNDPSIFNPQSAARARMRTYAQEIGSLHIISSSGSVPTKVFQKEEIPEGGTLNLYAVQERKPLAFMVIKHQARKIIREHGIDVVSAQDPFEYGWIAIQAIKGTSAKLHLQLHTDAFSPWFTRGTITKLAHSRMPLLNKVRVRIADITLPKAHGIRVVSERIKDSVLKRYSKIDAKKISVIPVPVSTTLPEPVPLPEHTFSFAFMTVGRLEAEKRIEDIIRALARIHMKYPSLGLLIVGEGRERPRLEQLTRTLGLTKNILFLGDRSDAIGLMQNAQGYIQASSYEGYGRTLIEAALARIPIITTDVGVVGEVFKGYEDVLSAPPGDPATLALHMAELLEDVQARRVFVINAEKSAHTHLAAVHTSPADIAANLRTVLSPAAS